MVIDIAIHEKVDAVNVQFSEFKANNDCYFNVRSSNTIYTSREIYTTDRILYQPVTTINVNGGHTVIKRDCRAFGIFLATNVPKKGI